MKAMCNQNVFDKKTKEEQMDMLELRETVDGQAKANIVRQHRHVPRRDHNSVLRVALNFEVSGRRKQ